MSFSFCSFPFVYEPATKASILSMSNLNTQMDEFQDALRDLSSWGGPSVPYLVLRVRPHLAICQSLAKRASSLGTQQSNGLAHLVLSSNIDNPTAGFNEKQHAEMGFAWL